MNIVVNQVNLLFNSNKLFVSLFTALLLTQCAHQVVLAAGSSEVSGLSFEQQGKSVQLTVDIDSAKANGAKVEKKKNGTVVIKLPKASLPKAYEQYGLPPIEDRASGLSATVQKRGDGIEIVVPAASSKNLKIQLKSSTGTVTPVASTTSSAPAKTITTQPKAVVSKPTKTITAPKTVVVKAATKTVAPPKKVTVQSVISKPIPVAKQVKPAKPAPLKVVSIAPVAKPVRAVTSNKTPATMPAKITPKVAKALQSEEKLIIGPIVPIKQANKAELKQSHVDVQPPTKQVILVDTAKKLMAPKTEDTVPSLLTPSNTNTVTPLSSALTKRLPTSLGQTSAPLSRTNSPNRLQEILSSPYTQWIFLICALLGGGLLLASVAVMLWLRSRKKRTSLFNELPDSRTVLHPTMQADMEEDPEMMAQPQMQATAPQQQVRRTFQEHLVEPQEQPAAMAAKKAVATQPSAGLSNFAPQNTMLTDEAATDMRFARLVQSRKKRF